MLIYEVRISHGARADMAELRKFLKSMIMVTGPVPCHLAVSARHIVMADLIVYNAIIKQLSCNYGLIIK